MTTEAPLNWIKKVQDALIEAQILSLSGSAPPFPWEALAQKMEELLHIHGLKITVRNTRLLPSESLSAGLGMDPTILALHLTPLMHPAFWIMGKEEIAKLSALALLTSQGNKGFSSPKFQTGFYYFLATQVTALLDELRAFKDLAPKIGKFSALPHEEALCLDIEIHHPKGTIWGRLVCPASFQDEFNAHYNTQPPAPLTSDWAEQVEVPLRLELGHTALPVSRFQEVRVGDFILLDRCSFDPDSHKGTVTLFLDKTALLRARIKEGSLKIVDYAFYVEETLTPSEEEEEMEEEFLSEEEPPLPEPQQDIPLMLLTVEVDPIRIYLNKLIQLTPGQMLEIPVKPEQGVAITHQGQIIAKAELVKLGELIGIKILQIGNSSGGELIL